MTADWYLTHPANAHSSLFLNIREYLDKALLINEADLLIKSYTLYQEQVQALGLDTALSVTRAWRLVAFVDEGVLTLSTCNHCKGNFVVARETRPEKFVCSLCTAQRSGERPDGIGAALSGLKLP